MDESRITLEEAIDRVLTDCKRGIFSDNPPFVPTQAPNISERIDAEIAAVFRRGERVVYLGDDAHRGTVGTVTRTGLTVLDEPAVEVVFRHGRRSSRKQIRVSRLARAEAVPA
jgi:hypothetical protein